jgi:hypothetical protein
LLLSVGDNAIIDRWCCRIDNGVYHAETIDARNKYGTSARKAIMVKTV